MSKSYHIPVLVQESLEYLRVEEKKKYIDATLGGGGHTGKILELGGEVLGLDVDQDAIDFVQEKLKTEKLRIIRGNFKDIRQIAIANGFENVDGILFDLGVSSHQLDTPERGFSFGKEGPLDMRMDSSLGVKAYDLINILTKGELYELFNTFGEERHAWAISNSIIRARGIKKIETTRELADIVRKSVKQGFSQIDPSTRVFQALRIAINDEFNNLQEGLKGGIQILGSGGRIVIISFHSLEDRIVKQAFLEFEQKGLGKILTKKPIRPQDEEININQRSRSAMLRAFEKI